MSAVELQLLDTSRPRSIRFVRKGALIPETYAAARHWDRTRSVDANIARIRAENVIGAGSAAWLHDVTNTLAARFRSGGGLEPLVALAQSGLPIEHWRDCLLWHLGQQDAMWFDFLTTWLYPAYGNGAVHMQTEDVEPFVITQTSGRAARGKGLTADSVNRVARDLLGMAAAFGLLRGKLVREFAGYHLADMGILYVLHALAQREANGQRIIEAPEWQMFLLSASDVEQELLRLHQFQRLDYQVAGSLVQLRLPYPSLLAYVESAAHA